MDAVGGRVVDNWKNILDYFKEIVEHGDQGETREAIVALLKKEPVLMTRLEEEFSKENDPDRKEILADVLSDFKNGEAIKFLTERGVY